jgi:hypothetical protein
MVRGHVSKGIEERTHPAPPREKEQISRVAEKFGPFAVVIALIRGLRYEIPLLKGCASDHWMTGGNGAHESEFVIFCR